MIKIAHIADVHIRNARLHGNYRDVFKKTFEQIKKDEVDLIFVLGDIAHTKINLSAEFFEMTHLFFTGLSEIAPVYSILGNHDANLANLSRQDSVSPVIQAMKDSNVNLLKYTGKFPVKNFPIDIYHYSVFDTHNWPKDGFEVDNDRISICMYHGPMDGCVTDAGYKMEYKINQSMFKRYDYTMLGDIHLCQPMDKDGRIWYSGSLIQQNYGESCDKGYLLWKIEDSDNWEIERRVIENPEPFVTGIVENGSVTTNHPDPPEGCYLRFVVKDEISTKELDNIISPIISKLKPKERRIKRATSAIQKLEEVRGSEDYRSSSVQAQLLKEFCISRGVDNKIINKVIQINNELCLNNEDSELLRNITFDIDSIEWDNMFSYGEGNRLNLSNIQGLIGIFGPNAIGKSSVVDSLLFSMFNKVSRKVPSIGNIVNNKKKSCKSAVTLVSGEQKYHIDRQAVWKKTQDVERGACSVYVDFYEYIDGNFEQNNGKSRPDTDSVIIRPKIGDYEDYVTTSISPQGSVSKFLEFGSADRKDYLIKILDIAFFDRQFENAKNKSKPLKALISTLGTSEEIKNKIKELRINEVMLESECSDLENELSEIENEKKSISDKISENNSIIDSIEKPKFNLKNLLNEKDSLNNKIKNIKNELEASLDELNELNSVVKNNNIKKPDDSELESLKGKVALWKEAETKALSYLNNIDILEKQASTLKKIPCGDSFPQCPLISSAIQAKKDSQTISKSLADIESLIPHKDDREATQSRIDAIEKELTNYTKQKSDIEKAESKIKILNAETELKLNKIELYQKSLKEVESSIKEARNEEEIINNIDNLLNIKSILDNSLSQLEKRKKLIEQKRDDNIKETARCSAKIEILENQLSDLKNALEEFEAYEHLIAGLSRNGIVQRILEDMQDAINLEIQDILSDIVPFAVTIDLSDPNCKMYIQYPDSEKRYLELASGMEKMISSLAIRVALIQLSSLPKLSTLIIDESFGALDSENVNAMGKMFESLRDKFKNIIIISHIDSIKDMVDHSITIEVDDEGYSKLLN